MICLRARERPDADECTADRFGFALVASRAVVAAFDGGRMTLDAGALLLGTTDQAIGLVERFADCFTDGRAPDLIEHTVRTLVGQRIFALALGYEDLIDHDQLRHDPALAVLVGKPQGLCAAGGQIDASADAVEQVARIVAQIRARWPGVGIVLRADSRFAREALMTSCEINAVDVLFRLAKNQRLVGEIAAELAVAAEESKASGQPARPFK